MKQPFHTSSDTPCFDLKGSVMTVLVLHIREADADRLYPQLDRKMGKAQAFFKNAPVLIDLSEMDEAEQAALDFLTLTSTLRGLGMVPVGVRGGASSQQERILQAQLGLLPAVKAERSVEASSEPPNPPESPKEEKPAGNRDTAVRQPAATAAATRVVTHPVRSGQQVHAPQGDLVILSSVNAGAEVLAAGNIHVYGALRGRALAGINGDASARIFSLQCNPELVAIAGEYLVNESLDQAVLNQSVLISLGKNGLKLDIAGSFTPA